MTTRTSSDYYRRGLELAEAGQYEEGWGCLREHLRDAPEDVQALNDAGVILHHLHRTQEALELLTKAGRLQADNAEIVCNLVEVYLSNGQAAEAVRLFDVMEGAGTLDIDVVNRAAALLLDQGHKGPAVEVLLRSQRLWPQQEQLPPILDAIRGRRPKVAFVHGGPGHDSVCAGLPEFVRQRFPTEVCAGDDPGAMAPLMDWCDIAWFDGGGPLLVEASHRDGPPKVVAGLRRSDAQGRWVNEVRWEKVDLLVHVGNSVAEVLREQVPEIHTRTRLAPVPYGVNLKRYPLRRRERGKHLACLGPLTMEANPAFLLQCMQKLRYFDAGYRLFFSGAFESPRLERYLRHMVGALGLEGVVFFESDPDDWNAWLSDKHFIVAAGFGEDRVETLLAALACGLKPVVHHFPGADKLLPSQYLFHMAEQFCEQVLAADYRPQEYRRLVEQRYPLAPQLKNVGEILAQLESEIEGRAAPAPGRETTAATNHFDRPTPGEGTRQA
jgi:tetratricopeptide (TPR) repeat protein